MQFYTTVLLLTLTVFGANAWPHMANEVAVEQSLFRMVMAQMSASMMDARALTPGETACLNQYNNATNKIMENLSNATSKCEDAANRTLVANNFNSNSSVSLIRSQLLTLEQNVQRCRNETDNQLLINCTVSHFDANLKLLDSSNSLSYQTQSQLSHNASDVQNQRTNCIGSAVSESKVKSIEAANDYDNCVARIPYQRELAAQKAQEQQPKDMPQQQLQQEQQKPEQQMQMKPQQQQPAKFAEKQPEVPAQQAI